MENNITDKQISEGLSWYASHQQHVNKLRDEPVQAYPPTEAEDVNNPALWKSNHWKWFFDEIRKWDEKRRLKHDEFHKKYNEAHACCPKCGETSHSTTLAAYVLIEGREDEYQDLNRCGCRCGYSCTKHERISEEEFKRLNNEK